MRQIGVTKKKFSERVSDFARNSASTVMTQYPGQLQHIVNVSSNCGRFLQVQHDAPKVGVGLRG